MPRKKIHWKPKNGAMLIASIHAQGGFHMKILIPKFVILILFSIPVFSNESPEALQDAFVKAMAANDADGLAACYTDDAVSYAVDAMVGVGPGFVRDSWNAFFSVYTIKEVGLSDTHMETFGDTAAAWGLFSMKVEPVTGGDSIEMRGRFMDVAKKVDGNWLYIADHASVPTPTAE
jgi:uncharacterized protein (TIGR02246 family)